MDTLNKLKYIDAVLKETLDCVPQHRSLVSNRRMRGGFEKLQPNAWKPFGTGQRVCIGRPFSWKESLLTIALVLKHFHIEFVDPSYDLRIKETLSIKPDGLKIRVRPRYRVELMINPTTSKPSPSKCKPSIDTSHLRPMSVLFSSNSGSCESFAGTLASEAPLYVKRFPYSWIKHWPVVVEDG